MKLTNKLNLKEKMSTNCITRYFQSDDKTWNYQIDTGDYIKFDSKQNRLIFNKLIDAQEHCRINQPNSGSAMIPRNIDE